MDEGSEHHVQLIEAREDPAIRLQAPEESLDLVATTVELLVQRPWVAPRYFGRHHGCEAESQGQLSGLVSLVCSIHDERELLVRLRQIPQKGSAGRCVAALPWRQRESHSSPCIRGNHMNWVWLLSDDGPQTRVEASLVLEDVGVPVLFEVSGQVDGPEPEHGLGHGWGPAHA